MPTPSSGLVALFPARTGKSARKLSQHEGAAQGGPAGHDARTGPRSGSSRSFGQARPPPSDAAGSRNPSRSWAGIQRSTRTKSPVPSGQRRERSPGLAGSKTGPGRRQGAAMVRPEGRDMNPAARRCGRTANAGALTSPRTHGTTGTAHAAHASAEVAGAAAVSRVRGLAISVRGEDPLHAATGPPISDAPSTSRATRQWAAHRAAQRGRGSGFRVSSGRSHGRSRR